MVFEPITLIIAFLLGLIPLLTGLKKKKYLYAIVGCLSTVLISGAMHVLVSIGLCVLFTWLILKVEQDPNEDKHE